MSIEKITRAELEHRMWEYNEAHPDREDHADLFGVIVYSQSNWPDKEYSLESRSYEVANNNRAYQPGKIANSIYACSLDGSDMGVRLDWYKDWKVEYCYMIGERRDDA